MERQGYRIKRRYVYATSKISLCSFADLYGYGPCAPPIDWSPELYFDEGSTLLSFRIMI